MPPLLMKTYTTFPTETNLGQHFSSDKIHKSLKKKLPTLSVYAVILCINAVALSYSLICH